LVKAQIIACRELSFIEKIRHWPHSYVTTWRFEDGTEEKVYTATPGGLWTWIMLSKVREKKELEERKKMIEAIGTVIDI